MNQARRQTRRRSAAHRMGVRCVFCCNNGKEVTGLLTMNDAREFIRATSPWAAMGLLVAILVIRGAASTKNAKDETAENYGMDGMSLGMCFGLLISVM